MRQTSLIIALLFYNFLCPIAYAEMTVTYNPPAKQPQTGPEFECRKKCGASIMNKYEIPGLSRSVPGVPDDQRRPTLPHSASALDKQLKECTSKCLKN